MDTHQPASLRLPQLRKLQTSSEGVMFVGKCGIGVCPRFWRRAPVFGVEPVKSDGYMVALTGIECPTRQCWRGPAVLSLVVSVLAVTPMLRQGRHRVLWCLPGACHGGREIPARISQNHVPKVSERIRQERLRGSQNAVAARHAELMDGGVVLARNPISTSNATLQAERP